MTDGERLVWAASYALAFDRLGDAPSAVHAATQATVQLRAASARRQADGKLVIRDIDERDFLDEMVLAP